MSVPGSGSSVTGRQENVVSLAVLTVTLLWVASVDLPQLAADAPLCIFRFRQAPPAELLPSLSGRGRVAS